MTAAQLFETNKEYKNANLLNSRFRKMNLSLALCLKHGKSDVHDNALGSINFKADSNTLHETVRSNRRPRWILYQAFRYSLRPTKSLRCSIKPNSSATQLMSSTPKRMHSTNQHVSLKEHGISRSMNARIIKDDFAQSSNHAKFAKVKTPCFSWHTVSLISCKEGRACAASAMNFFQAPHSMPSRCLFVRKAWCNKRCIVNKHRANKD